MSIFSRGKRAHDETAEAPSTEPDAAVDGAAAEEPAAADLTAAAPGDDAAGDDAAGDGPTEAVAADAEPAEADAAAELDAGVLPEAADAASESIPHVGISVTTFGKPTPRPASEGGPSITRTPAPPTGPVPGLRDNVLVRNALAALPENPEPLQLLNVARQLLQGHLFLRVKGDARALIAEGKELPLAMATVGEKKYALAYSSGAALQASVQADSDTHTSAMGQPVLVVLRHVLSGPYEGLILDHASAPARAVLPRPMLEKMLETIDEKLTLKTLLANPRSPQSEADLVTALADAPLWVAVNRAEEGGPLGIAEGRSDDGSRYLELYTHPLEVVAGGRGDQPAPIQADRLRAALRKDEGLSGVVLDPRGPWMRLTRAQLEPFLAE
ncbi:SseB family protein [Microbacterium hominis]|uniref:SseB family protein n=1 Tax=Microbacterium hominis TaxID=162426 RepID=A0A7D4TGJ0_9MICO|nr:SseB family protein [Microbacterium hominis]QKJ20180.1 SseB family protein [Microbacterium hominis]